MFLWFAHRYFVHKWVSERATNHENNKQTSKLVTLLRSAQIYFNIFKFSFPLFLIETCIRFLFYYHRLISIEVSSFTQLPMSTYPYKRFANSQKSILSPKVYWLFSSLFNTIALFWLIRTIKLNAWESKRHVNSPLIKVQHTKISNPNMKLTKRRNIHFVETSVRIFVHVLFCSAEDSNITINLMHSKLADTDNNCCAALWGSRCYAFSSWHIADYFYICFFLAIFSLLLIYLKFINYHAKEFCVLLYRTYVRTYVHFNSLSVSLYFFWCWSDVVYVNFCVS